MSAAARAFGVPTGTSTLIAPVPSRSQRLRQPHHVGALRGGEAAAVVADEHHDRAVGLGDGDRVTLLVIVGRKRHRRGFLDMLAGAEHDGETCQRARHAKGAAVAGG